MNNKINEEKMAIIRKLINLSDKRIIAEKTGFGIAMVKAVIGGTRSNEKILNCAYEMAKEKALILLGEENISTR